MTNKEEPFPMGISSPIDVEHPNEFLGREFLLGIYARAKAHARSVSDDYMMEVAERKPLEVKGYHWPNPNQVTLEDGTSVGKAFLADERFKRYSFGRYIFVPEQAQVIDEQGYRLSGTMRTYRTLR